MKNDAQAVQDYKNVLSIDPEFAPSLYVKGLAERGLGDISDSSLDILKVKENDPDVAEIFSE